MKQKYSIAELLGRLKSNWPEVVTPESEAILGIIRLNDLITDTTDRITSEHGLSPAAFEVLTTLRSLPQPRQMTPTELSRSVLITSGGMTKILNQLETDDLIERLENATDKRSQVIKLTKAGAKRVERTMESVMHGDRNTLAALPKSDVRQLKALLLQTLHKLET